MVQFPVRGNHSPLSEKLRIIAKPNSDRPFLLTIGVPVSNQIKTIGRCLEHIKPLLTGLNAELLVINTGSTDGTLSVCRNYHARIIQYPWCDNMSAVRNAGIFHARGEEAFLSYALEMDSENQPLQLLFLASYVLKRNFLDKKMEQDRMELFLQYMMVLGRYAAQYYRPELLDEMENAAIPGEIRAAYEVSIV